MNVIHIGDVRPLSNVLWNLYLAIISVLAAFAIVSRIRGNIGAGRRPVDLIIVAEILVWAGFLPNTCYLLTEWRHYISNIAEGALDVEYNPRHNVIIRLLVSTGFYVLYSGSGLVAFFLSIWPIERLVRERSPRRATALTIVIFFLCALGVYLGLIYRFNTWDLLKPSTVKSILDAALGALTRRFTIVLMIAFTGTLWLFYTGFDIWMDGLTRRLESRRRLGDTISDSNVSKM